MRSEKVRAVSHAFPNYSREARGSSRFCDSRGNPTIRAGSSEKLPGGQKPKPLVVFAQRGLKLG
ncbi:MAG: hypothetical protein WCF22_11590 [Candidatus Sulfotelmatobacter sp.]